MNQTPPPLNASPVPAVALWNGPGGQAWVQLQALLDALFAPFAQLLVDGVTAASSRAVLDVGCGTGGTTLAMARQMGSDSICVGMDISQPMLNLAQLRARREGSQARFVRADAQESALASGVFDAIVSRFGVMFFDDPVRAFSNLRAAALPGARLHCLAWRAATQNPFMTTAEQAALPLLGPMPARAPGGPGQFAFGDAQRVHAILAASGWVEPDIQAIDVTCVMSQADLASYVSWMGQVGIRLQLMDEPRRQELVERICLAFEPYVQAGEVRFTAACWTIGARNCM